VRKLAVSVAENNGALPLWMISAPEIASRYGVPVNVAQAATRLLASCTSGFITSAP
jgi:hypothetical protein